MKKLLLLLCAVLLAAGCAKQQNIQPLESNSSTTNSLTSSPSNEDIQNAGPPIYSGRPIFAGTLKISDNTNKGNLMLLAKPDSRMAGSDMLKNTTLYIKTQRDYTSLIGKKVLVGFMGYPTDSINNFKIINIVEDTGQTSFPE